MSDDKAKGREALNEIGVRLGDLFGAVRAAFDDIDKKARAGGAEAGRDDGAEGLHDGGATTTIETPHGPATVSAGWRVRVGGLDIGAGQSKDGDDFSSDPMKPGAAAAPPKPRDCQVEIFDETDAWLLTAELPGVAESELVVSVSTGALRFETTGARRYAHTVTIPSAAFDAVDWEARDVNLTNGILEIRAPKRV